MDVQEIASAVIQHLEGNPDATNNVLANPAEAIKEITGEENFDVNEVFQHLMGTIGDSNVDLSKADFSQLDLSQLDPSKFDLSQVASLAQSAGIDVSDLAGNLGLGDLGNLAGNLLGGLFGKK